MLLVAWAVRRAQGPLHDQRLLAVALPVVALAGAILVAFVAHPNGAAGLQACAKYAELSIVMLVLADVLCGPLAPRRAARIYVLACVAASLCGIVTAVLSERHRVVGPVANVDTLAFFLVAALPLVGTVRTRVEQPVWRVWACFAVLLAAGVGTQSRAALVAAGRHDPGRRRSPGCWRCATPGPCWPSSRPPSALVIAVLPLPIGQALSRPAALLRDQHRPAQRRCASRRSR